MKAIHVANRKTVVQEDLCSIAFVSTILLNFFAYLGNFMLLSTLPLHVLNIGETKIMAGLISGTYYLTGFIFRPKIGELLDRKEKRSIMLTSLIVLLLATISYNAVAYSAILLLMLRAIHGICWSATTTSVSTIASDLIPVSRITEGMGLFGISNSIAIALGPGLGLYVLEHYNHTLLFTLSAFFIALALLTGFWKCSHCLNPISTEPSITEKVKHRAEKNIKPMFFEKSVLGPSFLFFIVMMTYSTIGIFLPAYANEKGVVNIGIFFVVSSLATIFIRVTLGRIADKYGATKLLIPGMFLLAIAFKLLSTAPSLSIFLIAAVIYGVGFGVVQPTLNALVISSAPVERRGMANATYLCAMDLGVMVGSVIWGSVAQMFGFIYIYSASIILILLSVVIYLVIFKCNSNK